MTSVVRVRRGDSGYPVRLETIGDPPAEVWIRGAVPAEAGVAIVGTRRATRYGLGIARAMGAAVARAGWPVISGLARGVDGAAHRGCLDGDGIGIAVLGSGLDVWYPPEHRDLGEDLVGGGGGILSEYPPDTRPEPWRFPARNRLISGLSAVVVVTEAADKGGALITARLAAEQGREVFAVPGDVSRSTSVGTNLLIRDGALPVLGPDDLVEAVSLVLGPPPRSTAGETAQLGIDIPAEGAAVEMIVEAAGGDVAGALAQLGRLESDGRIRIEDGEVLPIA